MKRIVRFLLVMVTWFKSEPQNAFLLFAGVFGLAFVFLTPPMQSPDEVEHLYRAYQVSEFGIKANRVGSGYGGTLPVSVVDSTRILKNADAGQPQKKFDTSLLKKVKNTPLSPGYQEQIRFDNTAIYSPVPYLPQAVGIGVARTLHLNPLFIIYFGRIANLAAWIFLIYLAIRITPIGKWAFVVIALNPVSLFLSSTLSSDAVAIGLIGLFIAAILKARTLTKPLEDKWMLALGLLAMLICLTKNIYIPVVFLLLLIPKQIVSKYKTIAMIAAAVLVGLAWNAIILPIAQNIPSYFGMPGPINNKSQIHYIIGHPFTFIKLVANNVIGQQSSVPLPSYDGVFGWLDAPNPYWVDVLYFVMLLVSGFYREESRKVLITITKEVRLLSMSIFVVSSLALLGTLYVGYNKVGAGLIDGIQGRYYIPLTFLIVPICITRLIKLDVSGKIFTRFIYSSLATCLVCTGLTLVFRYY